MKRSRYIYAVAMMLVVAAGLLWRSTLFPLSPFYHKYGGDTLWALLIFLGFGLLFFRAATHKVAPLSLTFCFAVEFSQLYHTPWIDSVRGTRFGALVLGATFNWPDLIAYVTGIALGCLAEILLCRRTK